VRILGLDPGLLRTGWGVIEAVDGRLRYVECGVICPVATQPMGKRLAVLFDALDALVVRLAPEAAAVEETFVNRNPKSALSLGQARGIVLMTPARAGVPVTEYAATTIKKAVVGAGHAGKEQVTAMIRLLLPGAQIHMADAGDALAVAVCHAHVLTTHNRWMHDRKTERTC
jgi:crossover junction endodeoxyribonuclease RuvC